MMKWPGYFKLILPVIVFGLLVYFLWQGLQYNPHIIPSPFIGKRIPDFKSQTLANPNHSISNNDLSGKVILLNVFATWCYACRAEHSVLMDIHNSGEVAVYGLNYKDKRTLAKQVLKKYGNPYNKVIYDPSGKVGINLGVYGTPETFIIDRRGIIRYKYIGPISPNEWQDDILPKVKQLREEAAV